MGFMTHQDDIMKNATNKKIPRSRVTWGCEAIESARTCQKMPWEAMVKMQDTIENTILHTVMGSACKNVLRRKIPQS